MPRLLLEARWFISCGLCLGLFAILVTYSKADPAWSHASFEVPKNLGGRFGAYLADLLLYIFGISAFFLRFLAHPKLSHIIKYLRKINEL